MIKKISFVFTIILVFMTSAGGFIVKPQKVSAISGSDWRAGRIIDDRMFINKDAMSVADIQNFLNQNVGTGGYDSVPGQCDTSGARNAQPYSSSTRAQYAATVPGRSTTFTCLNNYYEVPKTSPGPGIPANNYGGAPIPPGAKSAAQLIWDAAQRYNISPRVLLVTIHKESAGPLTTDDWPFLKQYTYAMGAHCPDSGPGGTANCDANYAGFSIQISESAALYRYYLDNMNQPWWTYKRLGNNAVQYHPNAACGAPNVNIETMATAALYTYTPYQPNSTALSNIYGSQNDGCSSYGNRNFWRIFYDWFGSPTNPCGSDPVDRTISIYARGSSGDYTADGKADAAIFRPSDGCWHVRGYGDYEFGHSGDIPVPADYNGDRRIDMGVFRPSNGDWHIRGVGDYNGYGQSGDIPVPADYNGDGRTDAAVYRPTQIVNGEVMWHIRGVGDFGFGHPGDIPVPGDYNGDKRADIAIFRPSTGNWHIRDVGDIIGYGQSGDIPVPGDYNGRGRFDAAVYRPTQCQNGECAWHLRNVGDFFFGHPTDIPVPADYNGDSRNDVSVFRPSTGNWHLRAVGDFNAYGNSSDIPAIQTFNALLLKQYGLIPSY